MPEEIIQNPTYMEHVRHFFEEVDLDHMYWQGIDLSTYANLKENAIRVYFATRPPDAFMPPEPDRKWSQERSETFQNWIRNNYPFGKAVPQQPQLGDVTRVRKDVRDLSDEEVDTLAQAFRGLMARDPSDPKGYFVLAGIHWYPSTYCMHHVDNYNPWHRQYMIEFEDALRSVEGCEGVTLPFWDITSTPPDFLFEPPFASYTLPQRIHDRYPAGYVTSRFDAQTIASQVASRDIAGTIERAMRQSVWSEFNSWQSRGIIAAHDDGHPSCGATMSRTDAAAFDPLFWFFHSNWERLWWEWQQIMRATTYWTFRSTITGDTSFLEPPFNVLEPFKRDQLDVTADQTIDLSKLDVGYASPAGVDMREVSPGAERASFGSLTAAQRLRVAEEPLVSVRLKGIDRLVIPGSFQALLKADGETIARRAFFQSTEPRTCDTCRMTAVINLDFLVEADKISGAELTADIELLSSDDPRIGQRVPLYACGNPTINVRMLLQEAE
jgi:tyrosinase